MEYEPFKYIYDKDEERGVHFRLPPILIET